MSAKQDPEQKTVEMLPDAALTAGSESTGLIPAAEPDDFWDIDDALKHELINRSLRNMLGDC